MDHAFYRFLGNPEDTPRRKRYSLHMMNFVCSIKDKQLFNAWMWSASFAFLSESKWPNSAPLLFERSALGNDAIRFAYIRNS